jgi:hypothetical protein
VWFFAVGYSHLALLGTRDKVWFFAEVDLSGWFRILMLVYGCVMCVFLPSDVFSYLDMESVRFAAWARQKEENVDNTGSTVKTGCVVAFETAWTKSMMGLSDMFKGICGNGVFTKIEKFWDPIMTYIARIRGTEQEIKKARTRWRLLCCFWGFSILILTIAGIEKIIHYNDLTPENNLSRPGQLIPFVLGIITFIEGASKVCAPVPMRKDSRSVPRSVEEHPAGEGGSARVVGGLGDILQMPEFKDYVFV